MSCDGYLAFHALFPWKDVDVGIASVAFRGRLGGIGSGRAVGFDEGVGGGVGGRWRVGGLGCSVPLIVNVGR